MTRNFKLIVMLVVVLEGGLFWLTLSPRVVTNIGRRTLFPFIIVFFCLLPIYPLFRLAGRWPHFRVAVAMLVAGGLLTAAFAFLHYSLRSEGPLTESIFDLSQLLFFLSSVLFVWQGLIKRDRP